MTIQLHWTLDLYIHEDRNGDEPILQFAYLTHNDGAPVVLGSRTEVLRSSTGLAAFQGRISDPGGDDGPLRLEGMQTLPMTPTRDDAYLGIAVRAVEADNSSGSNRNADYDDFLDSIQTAADATSDGKPDMATFWTSANAPRLRDRTWKDDDDKLGVSARIYPNYGERIARASSAYRDGEEIEEVRETMGLTFQEDDAHWRMNATLRAYA